MKNLHYAVLIVALFSWSYSRAEGISQKKFLEQPTVTPPTTPCFQCPNRTEYGSLADAKKACGDQAVQGERVTPCPYANCVCVTKYTLG